MTEQAANEMRTIRWSYRLDLLAGLRAFGVEAVPQKPMTVQRVRKDRTREQQRELRELLKRLGMGPTAFGRVAGVSKQYVINRLHSNARPGELLPLARRLWAQRQEQEQ